MIYVVDIGEKITIEEQETLLEFDIQYFLSGKNAKGELFNNKIEVIETMSNLIHQLNMINPWLMRDRLAELTGFCNSWRTIEIEEP